MGREKRPMIDRRMIEKVTVEFQAEHQEFVIESKILGSSVLFQIHHRTTPYNVYKLTVSEWTSSSGNKEKAYYAQELQAFMDGYGFV